MKQVYFYLIFEKDHLGYATNVTESRHQTSLEQAIEDLNDDRKRAAEGFESCSFSPVIAGWEEEEA